MAYNFDWYTEEFVDLFDQEANDYVYNSIKRNLEQNTGLMISKFGTTELSNVLALYYSKHITPRILIDFLHKKLSILPSHSFPYLCQNSGFFPNDYKKYGIKYMNLVFEDCRKIDILGSYYKREKYINKFLNCQKKINIDGYISPFFYKNPWTKILENKKVLVVHPFAETILSQYQNREKLFENKDVLPKFKNLYVIKSVQSIAGNEVPFDTWFDALEYMKNEMDKYDYDIALIGCGAYGMHLAAHAKDKGKIGVHMASNVQLLFGIKGKRWEDDPNFNSIFNEYWVKPNENEKPKNVNKVENGCYW